MQFSGWAKGRWGEANATRLALRNAESVRAARSSCPNTLFSCLGPRRYFACESFYNIAKVCKGEILIYFNEIFDALSKVSVAVTAERARHDAD